MNKFETHNLNKKEVKLYPQMREKYEKFYDSYSKRVWQDMDQNYIELKEEIQWCLRRLKEIGVELDSLGEITKQSKKIKHGLKMMIADNVFELKNNNISNKRKSKVERWNVAYNFQLRLTNEELKEYKRVKLGLIEEKDIIQNNYLYALKRLKEDLRQEKYQAFQEEVLNQLHISDILSSNIDSLKEQLKEKERINVNNI